MTTGTEDRKVLSIGYGAFTVRLEGFDDPFPYLKRITEYFRVIAHHDRTFGSKPLSAHPEAMKVFSEVMNERGADVALGETELSVTPSGPTPIRQVQDFVPSSKPAKIVETTAVAPNEQLERPVLQKKMQQVLPLTGEYRSPLIVKKEDQTLAESTEDNSERVLLRPGKAVQGFSMFGSADKGKSQSEKTLGEFKRAFRRYQVVARGAKTEREDNPFSRLRDEVRETLGQAEQDKLVG